MSDGGFIFREAKEFPHKIAASGWDLAARKSHVTTAFSGTNDHRYLLPTMIHQHYDPAQAGTNAQVLSYLLQKENQHYRQIPFSGVDYLALLAQERNINVILDIGAQLLNYTNQGLAEKWLLLRPNAMAVVFFRDDELAILTRDGTVEAFISSPFNQRLSECLVFLDDVHTRGTDLKLPRTSRAAVTLGPGVTKDRLVQGTALS